MSANPAEQVTTDGFLDFGDYAEEEVKDNPTLNERAPAASTSSASTSDYMPPCPSTLTKAFPGTAWDSLEPAAKLHLIEVTSSQSVHPTVLPAPRYLEVDSPVDNHASLDASVATLRLLLQRQAKNTTNLEQCRTDFSTILKKLDRATRASEADKVAVRDARAAVKTACATPAPSSAQDHLFLSTSLKDVKTMSPLLFLHQDAIAIVTAVLLVVNILGPLAMGGSISVDGARIAAQGGYRSDTLIPAVSTLMNTLRLGHLHAPGIRWPSCDTATHAASAPTNATMVALSSAGSDSGAISTGCSRRRKRQDEPQFPQLHSHPKHREPRHHSSGGDASSVRHRDRDDRQHRSGDKEDLSNRQRDSGRTSRQDGRQDIRQNNRQEIRQDSRRNSRRDSHESRQRESSSMLRQVSLPLADFGATFDDKAATAAARRDGRRDSRQESRQRDSTSMLKQVPRPLAEVDDTFDDKATTAAARQNGRQDSRRDSRQESRQRNSTSMIRHVPRPLAEVGATFDIKAATAAAEAISLCAAKTEHVCRV